MVQPESKKKYIFTRTETVEYRFEIEAESRDKATEIFSEAFNEEADYRKLLDSVSDFVKEEEID